MSIINNGLLLASGADAATGYQISRSLRFDSASSGYLSRTPGSAGSRTTWTWSAWIKRSKLGAAQEIWGAYTGTGNDEGLFYATFESDDKLYIYGWSSLFRKTTQVFRDVSAWYHIVIVADVTNGTANNRLRIYVNGTEITTFDTITNPASTSQFAINSASAHYIGADPYSPSSRKGDYMLADVYLLDGTATTPSTFAETDAITGQWVPKTPTSISYGTNGFRLTFSDNSGTTSTTLGKDAAGSNNWTPNNFSVASGSGNDSLVDSPTSYGTDTGAGGEVRGNYCVCNPLLAKSNETYSNGNLDVSVGAPGPGRVWGTIGVSSGKWYFEHTQTSGTYTQAVGIKSNFVYNDASNNYMYWGYNGNKVNASGVDSSYGASWGNNDVIGVAFDLDAGTITFYKNGVSQGQAFSGITAGIYFPVFMQYSGGSCNFNMNFGQRQWAYAPPSGFRALCDTNLTAPTIAKPNTVMDIALYSGTDATKSITFSSGLSPDLVWIKCRSVATSNGLFDVVRGTNKGLFTNNTLAEQTYTSVLTSFDSSGFTLGSDDWTGANETGNTYVAWCFDGGSSNSTNTQGSITSTVRANATAGFSIVTYTGTGANATVGHGCGAAPSMIITKSRNNAYDWTVYHSSLGINQYLFLNSTAAATTNTGYWNTAPTSTIFGVGNNNTGSSGSNIVAYCFAPVAGYSAFGSFSGGSAVFVYAGFLPRWVLLKQSSASSSWIIYDTARDTYNVMGNSLYPDLSSAEISSPPRIDFVSNGFITRAASGSEPSWTGTVIYAAFAQNPFQYARAR